MPFLRRSLHPSKMMTTATITTHSFSPVTIILVFTCLLNSSHLPACSASADCSGEVEAYKRELQSTKENADKEVGECKSNLKLCEGKHGNLKKVESSYAQKVAKLEVDLKLAEAACESRRAVAESNTDRDRDLWRVIYKVGAVFFLISIIINIFLGCKLDWKQAELVEANKRLAASEAELKSGLHQHATFSYQKQYENLSKKHLNIDVRMKQETPLALTDAGGQDANDDGGCGKGGRGGGREGGNGGSGGGGVGSSGGGDHCGSREGAQNGTDFGSNGPPGHRPAPESNELRYRRT